MSLLLGQSQHNARSVQLVKWLSDAPAADRPGVSRASLKRLGKERLALGQLHWSTANYQPLQERALWDGLAAMYDQVLPWHPP